MRLLTDREINENISLLDKCWEGQGTFGLVPERSGVTTAWIQECLASLPTRYRTGHFALLTSGSTGLPKLVVGERARSERLADVLHQVQESQPVRETILLLPLTYCYAFVNQWLWSRVSSRRLVQTPGLRSPEVVLKHLKEADGAMLCLVGAQLPLFRKYLSGQSFGGVIRVHFAGGPFPQDDLGFVREMFPNASVFNNYGCAEAMPRLTVRRAEDAEVGYNVGKPLPGVGLASTEEGALMFQSPYGAVVQIDPEGIRELDGTWVGTGDLGEEEPDGSWVLKGRASEVFKRYGEKISLPRIVLSVREVWAGQVATYRQRDRTGQDGYVLMLAPEPSDEEVRAVLRMFRQAYPRTHWPLRIESVGTLPTLGNQKIDVLSLEASGSKRLHWDQRV